MIVCYHGLLYEAVPHARFGNERAWSVTGDTLHLGQIVQLHAMFEEFIEDFHRRNPKMSREDIKTLIAGWL